MTALDDDAFARLTRMRASARPRRALVEGDQAWERSMEFPQVLGLVVGRSLLFPFDGDVKRWVDLAAEIVHGG